MSQAQGGQPGSAGGASLLRRIVSAQEFGLVAVIVLMMIGLTVFSESIERSERVWIEGAVQIEQTDEAFIIRLAEEEGGTVRTFPKSAGWDVFPRGDGHMAERKYKVDKFLNRENLIGIATSASFIAIMAVGMAGIIIMGGIDLSVGSIYALSAVVGAMVLSELGRMEGVMPGVLAIPIGLAICCAIGGACGFVNGAATVGLRVHPFIITLGGMAVYRGIAFVSTKGQSIGGFPESYTQGGFRAQAAGGIMPVPMLLMVAVALAGAFVLQRTVFGRWTYAIGGNETAARYAGIAVGRTKILLFTIGGALAGLSAAVMLGYFGAASSDAGSGYELRVIAAAVVGGASLTGGRGSAIGAMLGAVVIQLIDNGILVLGIDSNYTNIVIGLAIVLAVVVDQAKHRLMGKRG